MKRIIYLSLFGLLLSGCGGNKGFSVDVDVPALGTQEITVVYETDSRDREIIRVPAIEGKFEFSGYGADSTMVEIYTAKKMLFASFPILRGEDLKLRAHGDSLYVEDKNLTIITSYPDTVLSEWPRFESPEVIITYDSVSVFPPEGIWIFTASTAERSEAILDTLRYYTKETGQPVRDVFISGDLSLWRSHTRRDSATWTQGFLPDAPLVLGEILTFTPSLVEVDTLGRVLRVQRLK